MELFQKCLDILRTSQTDTEKFAALLLVTKTFKSDTLADQLKNQLYAAIGDRFLQRLIHTADDGHLQPTDLPNINLSRPSMFQNVAAAILSVLVSMNLHPEDDSSSGCLKLILTELEFFKNALESNQETEITAEQPQTEDVAIHKRFLDDVLFCLSAVTCQDEHQRELVERGLLDSLCGVYVRGCYGDQKALQLVIFLTAEQPRESWSKSSTALYAVLNQLAAAFRREQTGLKFEKLQMLITLLSTHPVGHVVPTGAPPVHAQLWVVELREAIFELIASQAFKAYTYRDAILKLASVLTDKLGVSWFALCDDKQVAKQSRKFVALLIHLVTIEIRLILDGRQPETVVQDATLLMSCYSILECFITVTNDYMWEVIRDFTKQLLESVTCAAASVIHFVTVVAHKSSLDRSYWSESEPIVKDIVLASVRLLCCWLSQETDALRPEVVAVLPFIIQLARESFTSQLDQFATTPLDGEDVSEPNRDQENCLLRLLLPPLCHLSADNLTRPVLMKENVPRLLFQYTQRFWPTLTRQIHPPSTPNSDTVSQETPKTEEDGRIPEESLEVTLSTVCGVLLNIVVMESEAVSSDPVFFEIFRFLHTSLPQICSSNRFLSLQANFSVLGLLMARLQSSRLRSCQVGFYKFLSSSIKFLWNAHEICSSPEDLESPLAPPQPPATFALTADYAQVWPDIAELWFLALQALSSLLSIIPWIGDFLLTSGWPQHVVSCLELVAKQDIDSCLVSAYQNFLCCLVKLCPDDVQPLRDNGILNVACQHSMKELEHLLHVVDISGCQSVVAASRD